MGARVALRDAAEIKKRDIDFPVVRTISFPQKSTLQL